MVHILAALLSWIALLSLISIAVLVSGVWRPKTGPGPARPAPSGRVLRLPTPEVARLPARSVARPPARPVARNQPTASATASAIAIANANRRRHAA